VFVVGYLASFLFESKEKLVENLTIYDYFKQTVNIAASSGRQE
jgi:hypothetical protein